MNWWRKVKVSKGPKLDRRHLLGPPTSKSQDYGRNVHDNLPTNSRWVYAPDRPQAQDETMTHIRLPWWRKRKVVKEKKSAVLQGATVQSDTLLGQALQGVGKVTAVSAAKIYTTTSSVSTAVDLLASSVEQLIPVIRNRHTKKVIGKHKLLDLLRAPNTHMDWRQFIGTMARDFLLKSDSLVISVGYTESSPIEIWPKSLAGVGIGMGLDGLADYYSVLQGPVRGYFEETQGIGYTRYMTRNRLAELHHVRGYSANEGSPDSTSKLDAILLELEQLVGGRMHNIQMLNNGGRLSLLVFFKDEEPVEPEEHRARVDELNRQWTGANAGKIGAISNADVAEVKDMGVSQKDMDFSALENTSSLVVFARYHIPLSMVSIAGTTFNNVTVGIESFYDLGVLPLADILFKGLERATFKRFGLDIRKYELTYDMNAIRALKDRKMREILSRRQIGVETVNELRELYPDRESLDDCDVPVLCISKVPTGDDGDDANKKTSNDTTGQEPSVDDQQ